MYFNKAFTGLSVRISLRSLRGKILIISDKMIITF
jgi:hypothetical protein